MAKKTTKESIIESLIKRGFSAKEAKETIDKTELSDEVLKTLLLESKQEENRITNIPLDEIFKELKEGFEIALKIKELNDKKYKKMNSKTLVKEFTEKHFNQIFKATEELEKRFSKKIDEICGDEAIKKIVLAGKDIEEEKLKNNLTIYRFKKSIMKEIDEKYHITDEMKKEYHKQTNQKMSSIDKFFNDKINPLSNDLELILQRISKSLFISLEESNMMVSNINFFNIFFNTLDKINEATEKEYKNVPYFILQQEITKVYDNKQVEMKERLKEVKRKKKATVN